MKNLVLIVLIIVLVIPSISTANSYDDIRVFDMGIMGQGDFNLDRNISRAELATVSVRLAGLEYLKGYKVNSTPFKDVSGWSIPYINIVNDAGFMKGNGKNTFNPDDNVKYVELLTVLMRILGYEDEIDFEKYPDDYYSKALEIGLGNLYIPYDEMVTRGVVAKTINKALDLKLKNRDIYLSSLQWSYSPVVEKPVIEIKNYLEDLSLNTTIVGVFSGVLKGADFQDYRVVLLSKSGNSLKSTTVGRSGSFSIEGFDIGTLAKLQGYKYEVYSPSGALVLWDDLD